VNTAVYAVPHVVDEGTVAWGMTDGRTWDNVRQNPHAAYVYFAAGKVFAERGSPVLLRTEIRGDAGENPATDRQGESRQPGGGEARGVFQGGRNAPLV